MAVAKRFEEKGVVATSSGPIEGAVLDASSPSRSSISYSGEGFAGYTQSVEKRLGSISRLLIDSNALPALGIVLPYDAVPHPAKVQTVRNRVFKPTGGLWTSPVTCGGRSTDWVDWCYNNKLFPGGCEHMKMWGVSFPDDAVIAKIGDGYDTTLLFENFRDPAEDHFRSIDFVGLTTAGVDALWVTGLAAHHGNRGIDLSENPRAHEAGHERAFMGWDCDTVLWLNRFDRIGFRDIREFSLHKTSDGILGPLWSLDEEEGLGEGYWEE